MKMEIFTGMVLIDRNQRIYLIREEDKNKIGKNRWNLPGGSIDNNEGIVKSAEREALEETGYKIEVSSILGCYQCSKGGKSWIFVVVGATPIGLERSSITDPSVKKGRWFKKEKFLNMDIAQMVHTDMKLVYKIAIEEKGLKLDSVKFINYDDEI